MRIAWRAAALIVLFLATGCAISTGELKMNRDAGVVLARKNFRVVKTNVRGRDTGIRVFFLGNSPTYANAMAELRATAEILGQNRALINITRDRRIVVVPPFTSETIILTADVVEFTDGPVVPAPGRAGGGGGQ